MFLYMALSHFESFVYGFLKWRPRWLFWLALRLHSSRLLTHIILSHKCGCTRVAMISFGAAGIIRMVLRARWIFCGRCLLVVYDLLFLSLFLGEGVQVLTMLVVDSAHVVWYWWPLRIPNWTAKLVNLNLVSFWAHCLAMRILEPIFNETTVSAKFVF